MGCYRFYRLIASALATGDALQLTPTANLIDRACCGQIRFGKVQAGPLRLDATLLRRKCLKVS